jgi:hypothetical protein
MVLVGLRRANPSPPKHSLRSPFSFILLAIDQLRSDSMASTRLRDLPTLDTFLLDQPILFSESIYARFPAQVAPFFGRPDST